MSTGNIPLASAIPDELITSALWNAEFANIQTLTTPEGIEGYEDTDSEMQIQTNPFPGSVTSHATSLAGEIERIRYQLAQLINGGTDFWYKKPPTDITTAQNSLVPVGGVIDYPTNTPPSANWHLADGTAISRAGFPTLFALIGTTFGVGDGSTTFNLPDYRDRMSIGAGTSYAVAATGGAATSTVAITDPGHNHTQNSHTHTMANHTHTGPSHTHSVPHDNWSYQAGHIVGNLATSVSGTDGTATADQNTGASGTGATSGPSTNTSDAATAINNSNTTGITATNPNLPPYLAMYKMIRVL